jgi:Mat/Ecp fimbriae major subunit
MRNLKLLFSAIFLVAGFTGRVMAQVTLAGNTAGATLVEVLTIANTVPLNFGVIGITSGTAGTVVMNTAGLRTPGAATTTIIATGTPSTVAQFDLTGTTDAVYTIGLPLAITVTTGAGLGDLTMDIDALMVKVDAAAEATAVGATGTLTGGASTILLGGRLNISTTQEIGVYAGTYDVTVDYQ